MEVLTIHGSVRSGNQQAAAPAFRYSDLLGDARLVEVWHPDAISPTIADVSLELAAGSGRGRTGH